jgi:hypothetical protein
VRQRAVVPACQRRSVALCHALANSRLGWLHADARATVQFQPGLTADELKSTLFKDVWAKPVCDLFTSKDAPDFVGTCDAAVIGADAHCADNSFCSGLADTKRSVVEATLAGHIAETVLGFVTGSGGLSDQDKSISKVRHTHRAARAASPCCGVACTVARLHAFVALSRA